MSQSKTVIQGLDSTGQAPYGQTSNFYSRGNSAPAHGTVVPGMMGADTSQQNHGAAPQPGSMPQSQPKMNLGKPVVGFLYSVSRTAAGEYWPLHVGQNTIGKSASCDIVLQEGTVSQEHAVLVVRKMKKPEKVIASINDARSTNGTMLNGESLGFSAEECHDGDIITIGDNYELYLVLIDVAEKGLHVQPDFIAVETEEPEDPDPWNPADPYTHPMPGPAPYPQPFNPTPGTVGMDGTSPNIPHGGTIPM